MFGLGSTKYLSLPMFTSLRHSTVLMTMCLEYALLKFDSDCTLFGYIYICINNFSTALNSVYIKLVFNKDLMSTTDIMFYNNLFAAPFLAMVCFENDDFMFTWLFYNLSSHKAALTVLISIALLSGICLGYFSFQCTKYNSALTTTFIGVLKNVIITYSGMFTGDYTFNLCNFIGVTLTTIGSLIFFGSAISGKLNIRQQPAKVVV
ncbi:unnamed protein product [Bursaphelenchus okinawaensis]|uniref:Sugar phosphate transporter domain-containing protein n=1 Tax=Bursaphelenchus okinawaensis TaxID=465554 RepID=A0A811KZ80_9BILA|nr:unnamed protein product [Bursaphelenchus okinawaensis]CAG9114196.1 unnamed protein product [Bursaphelenchus okinawaensis]